MSEELLQRDLIKNPEKIGTWDFHQVGATTVKQLTEANIIRSIDYGNVARKKVDAIITRQKEVIAKSTILKNYYKISGMGVEGLFMEWIVKALKPNGKAFVVVPDGIFNRQNDKNLRQLILDNCFIDAIISLPLKTFFTTPKKTYILAITKKHDISQIQTDPVFTYLCSEIGESRDIYRFDIEQDDLKEAVNLFNAFKGSKKYFANINHDKRCKLQGIDKFKADINWCVENFFTEEEKIDLGFIEKTGFLYIKEFNELLNDTLFIISSNANIINESQNLEQIKYDTKQASIFFDLLPMSKKNTKKGFKR